jgi:hypothetical protein
MDDLRSQLAAVFPKSAHYLLFQAKGCKHPPFNESDVVTSFTQFCTEFLPRSPISAPQNKSIRVIKTNFPKFLNMKRLCGSKVKASRVIEEIESGNFEASQYKWEIDRIRTLFWMPDVLADPDAVYKNAHKIVEGDEVYVKVYDKMGARVKLVFTDYIKPIKQTVIVTSFLTDPETAWKYVRGEPLYARPKTE